MSAVGRGRFDVDLVEEELHDFVKPTKIDIDLTSHHGTVIVLTAQTV